MSHRTLPCRLLLAVIAALWSCDFATDVDLLGVEATGILAGQAFLDLNGNGVGDGADEPLTGIVVVATTPGTGDVLVEVSTDSLGFFQFPAVPVGAYSLGLDSSALGDSLTTFGVGGSVTVALGDTVFVTIGASYPILSLNEVRAAPAGRRVFALGVTLNARAPSTDGTVHLLDTTEVSYLRTTRVNVASGDLFIGDSVRFLGRTAMDNGQPVLDNVTPYVLERGLSIPPPVEATIGEAAAAKGGSIDAALVRIRSAEISDTSSAPNGDFHFWADNGTDSVEVVFKWFRGIPSSGVRPDTIVQISQLTGLLTPFDDGGGNLRWRLLPRSAAGVVLVNKSADVAITTAFTPTAANVGDTVEIRVVAANTATSTHAATGVAVSDTIPAGLVFLSAVATAGSYDDLSARWNVGDLSPGAADTLRISAQVAGPPGTLTNTAYSEGLVFEVETNSGNDTASATLTVP